MQNSSIDALDFGDAVSENYGRDQDSNLATDEFDVIAVPSGSALWTFKH